MGNIGIREQIFQVGRAFLAEIKGVLEEFDKQFMMTGIEEVKKYFFFSYKCSVCGQKQKFYKILFRPHHEGKPYGNVKKLNLKKLVPDSIFLRNFENRFGICPAGHAAVEVRKYDRVSEGDVRGFLDYNLAELSQRRSNRSPKIKPI